MHRQEDEFWRSSLAHVVKMVDMYADKIRMQAAAMKNEEYRSKYFSPTVEIRDIQSMSEIEGW